MGMYTELQGTVVFKTPALATAFCTSGWGLIGQLVEEVKYFETFSRSHWIPNTTHVCDGCVVQFHSELKNYDHTIEEFLKILPLLATNWLLESKYEECSCWTLHTPTEDGKLVNGDNGRDLDWAFGNKVEPEEYPNIDVFDEDNLETL